MRGFLVRLLITALGLWVADQLLPGITFFSTGALIVSALLLGFVNALVRPILIILTLPLTILTLGLFILIVNGISLALARRPSLAGSPTSTWFCAVDFT